MKKTTFFALLMAGALCASAVNPINPTVTKNLSTDKTQIAATRANGLIPKASKAKAKAPVAKEADVLFWGFEPDETASFNDFTIIDNDGDGFNWQYFDNTGLETGRMTPYEGEGVICSASYDNDSETALNPDNWLVSPEVTLGGALKFFARGQDNSYAAEVFGVFVCVGEYTSVEDFVQVGVDLTTTNEYVEHQFDLSEYAGQVGHFAIRHYNVTDMFWLNIDNITLDVNAVAVHTPTVPTELEIDPQATTALASWTEGMYNDKFNLRYRPVSDPMYMNHFFDFPLNGYEEQLDGWLIYDADGDGNGWGLTYSSDEDDICLYSASYAYGALTPDNWLISPAFELGGSFSFNAWAYLTSWPDVFRVYLLTDAEEFEVAMLDNAIALSDDIESGEKQLYEYDLAAYSGIGRFAIRHYNCTDQYRLMVDDFTINVPNPIEEAEWTVCEDVSNPYVIEGLTPATEYEAQVQGVMNPQTRNVPDAVVTEWSEKVKFTTQESTGIATVKNADNTVVRYYDISGRYVGTSLDSAPAGLYIGTDGKKVVK